MGKIIRPYFGDTARKRYEEARKSFMDRYYFGREQGKKEVTDRICRCYCDDICEKGLAGMCWHKHDGEGQIKNDFKYNECNELKLLRNSVKKKGE